MPNLKDIEEQAAFLLGLTQQSVGKTQARKEFFPLVDSLGASGSVVEITDHDKPVAVLLSYQHYVALTAKLCMFAKSEIQSKPPNLMGSVKIKTDDLEAASAEIAEQFKNSLDETARKL